MKVCPSDRCGRKANNHSGMCHNMLNDMKSQQRRDKTAETRRRREVPEQENQVVDNSSSILSYCPLSPKERRLTASRNLATAFDEVKQMRDDGAQISREALDSLLGQSSSSSSSRPPDSHSSSSPDSYSSSSSRPPTSSSSCSHPPVSSPSYSSSSCSPAPSLPLLHVIIIPPLLPPLLLTST